MDARDRSTHELSTDAGRAPRAIRLRCEERSGTPPFARPTLIQIVSAGDSLALGRSSHADLVLADTAVSARHAQLTYRDGAVEVTDLSSRNGLWVGGARVARAIVAVGGEFEIGRTLVKIEAEPDREQASAVEPLAGLVGKSEAMLALASDVRRVAALRLPVLLRGESGTGKDLIARAVHSESQRRGRPYVALNAATISRELAESELFGHQRGAFTGAIRSRRGAFREAHTGTLFLDEIAALPLDVQPKLLRAVEESVVRALGAEEHAAVDVRLVVATCEPLEALVAERAFRADLYERLAVCLLRVPPLRERTEDIPLLARHMLDASELGDRELTRSALAALRAHRWPGNVRELRNVVVQAALRAERRRIHADDVAAVLAARGARLARRVPVGDAVRAFEETGRNVSAAARRLDIPRSTMRDLLKTAKKEQQAL